MKREINVVKKEARKLAKQRMASNLLKNEMTFFDFRMKSSQLYYFDDMQTIFQNQCRANSQNILLESSENWDKICELRRVENGEEKIKKEIAKLIKISLCQVLNSHPVYLKMMPEGFTEDNVDGFITDYSKKIYERDNALVFLELGEQQLLKEVTEYLEKLPIYTGYCKNVKGLGAKTAAKLISGIGDIRRFENPAKLWSYCGYGDSKADKRQKGVQLKHSPKMKSLLFVIGENFIKQNGQYRIVYDKRKEKTLTTHPEWHNLMPDGTPNTGKNMHPKHAHTDAQRVMIKRFLAELWAAWYLSLGMDPPCQPYGVEIKGHHLEKQIVEYKSYQLCNPV